MVILGGEATSVIVEENAGSKSYQGTRIVAESAPEEHHVCLRCFNPQRLEDLERIVLKGVIGKFSRNAR